MENNLNVKIINCKMCDYCEIQWVKLWSIINIWNNTSINTGLLYSISFYMQSMCNLYNLSQSLGGKKINNSYLISDGLTTKV